MGLIVISESKQIRININESRKAKAMSKPLEQMTNEELSQYMKDNQNNHAQWQKAYDLFAAKSDWQEVPEGATWEEQKRFIEDFISQVIA